jgi:hypothetical protein
MSADDVPTTPEPPNEEPEPKRLKLTIDEAGIDVVKAADTKYGARQLPYRPVEIAQAASISLRIDPIKPGGTLPELTRRINEWAADNLDADTQALHLPLSEATVRRALLKRRGSGRGSS